MARVERSLPVAERPRRPEWMKVRAPSANTRYFEVKGLMREGGLHTICEEARCPNIGECWGRGTATFQILGDTCTRACRYCYVHSGKPDGPPDPLEPLRLAQAAAQMKLSHVVVTSVDRDDLEDRGAGHYAATIRAIKRKLPAAKVEILTPDFLGVEEKALATAGPATNILEDLKVNSARLVDVVLAFEDEFDIEIADEDVDSVNTIGDCVALIQQKVA